MDAGMKTIKTLLPLVAAAAWISVSEFARNELLFKSMWIDHYRSMGLSFPSDPGNGALWGLWSLLFAVAIYLIEKKFSLVQTTMLAWLLGFVLMWVVIGNLGVLPMRLLPYAAPLSLLETFVAAWIIRKLRPGQ